MAKKLIIKNKYKDRCFVEKYAAIWAFGYLNGFGQSEGLYRAVNELGFSTYSREASISILDVGCGVGRTASDYAKFFLNSTVLGIDNASLMIRMARRISGSLEKIKINIERDGLGKLYLKGEKISNLSFQELTLEEIYRDRGKNVFDIITAVNFLDRVDKVESSLKIIFQLLKREGICIITTPLNFTQRRYWQAYFDPQKLLTLVKKTGFKIDISFDNLIYKEILDGRGASEEYPTLIMRLKK